MDHPADIPHLLTASTRGHMSLTSIGFGALIGLLAVAMIGKCAEERFHSATQTERDKVVSCSFVCWRTECSTVSLLVCATCEPFF